MENELKLQDSSIVESYVTSIYMEDGDTKMGVAITVAFTDSKNNPMAYEEIILTKDEIKRLWEMVTVTNVEICDESEED